MPFLLAISLKVFLASFVYWGITSSAGYSPNTFGVIALGPLTALVTLGALILVFFIVQLTYGQLGAEQLSKNLGLKPSIMGMAVCAACGCLAAKILGLPLELIAAACFGVAACLPRLTKRTEGIGT